MKELLLLPILLMPTLKADWVDSTTYSMETTKLDSGIFMQRFCINNLVWLKITERKRSQQIGGSDLNQVLSFNLEQNYFSAYQTRIIKGKSYSFEAVGSENIFWNSAPTLEDWEKKYKE